MSTNPTKNYAFSRPDFNVPSWHDDVNDNFTKADTLLKILNAPANIASWAPNTLYVVGTELFDSVSNSYYTAGVTHTSGLVSFATDRAANPTYWIISDHTFRIRGEWAPGTLYNAGDLVTDEDEYIVAFARTTHVSTTGIRVDIANWIAIADLKDAVGMAVGSGIEATVANIRSGISAFYLSIRKVYEAGLPVSLTRTTNTDWNMATGLNFDLVLDGNVTQMNNPTNQAPGKSGLLRIKQDATGGRTFGTWAANYKWIGGLPEYPTAANAFILVSYFVWANGEIYMNYGGGS